MTQKERCSEITLSKKNYENEYEFWDAATQLIKTLSDNDYIFVGFADRGNEEDSLILEFNRSAPLQGEFSPYWLTAEEIYEHEQQEFESRED